MRTKEERITLLSQPPPWFMFAYNNYQCLAVKHPSLLHYCGYVQLPGNHPISIAKPKLTDSVFDSVEVHGGITYSEQSEVSYEWVVGFDCAHGGDMTAAFDGIHRTAEFVINELRKLVKQLLEIEGADVKPAWVKSCYNCKHNKQNYCRKTGLDLSRKYPVFNWHCSNWELSTDE
jgi:hypothetical protein